MVQGIAASSGINESLVWLDYLDVRNGLHDPDAQFVADHIKTWGHPPQLREDMLDQGRRILYESAASLVFTKHGLSELKDYLHMARRYHGANAAVQDAERLLAGYLKASTCKAYATLIGDDARIFVTIASSWFLHRGMLPDECITDPLYLEEAAAVSDLLERREIAQ